MIAKTSNAAERREAPSPGGSDILALIGVTAGYGAGLILKGVDLTVEAGKIVCLIGPNGAGKSTVLKTISGLLRPSAGQVMLRGEDISRLSSKDRLIRGVVHVPQERSLFPGMSVWENVLMGAFILSDQAQIRRRIEGAAEASQPHERARPLSSNCRSRTGLWPTVLNRSSRPLRARASRDCRSWLSKTIVLCRRL